MIIGRYCIDPADIVSGSYTFDSESISYRVVIERADGAEYDQTVTKKEDADRLLKLIDKAIKEGSGVREARRVAAWGDDEED